MLGNNVWGKEKVTGKGELNSEEGEQGEGVIDWSIVSSLLGHFVIVIIHEVMISKMGLCIKINQGGFHL
jgi:hypothetical protein